MPRKTCTTCNERKPIEDFQKDHRCADGYAFRCQDCRNVAVATTRPKVKCPNCDGTYARSGLAKHMKSKKCIDGELEWKHPMKSKNRFKSDGKEYVTCPCKHEQCQVTIKESTAFRHMKYGIGYKFPAELKRLKERENQRMPVWIITDSGLVRDLDDSDSERDL